MQCDVLVIGSGAAGLLAAIEARRHGLEVVLACKGSIGRGTNTSFAGGGFTVATQWYTAEQHFQHTMEVGRYLNNEALVTTLVREGPQAVGLLSKFGIDLHPTPKGWHVLPGAGHPYIPGIGLSRALVRAAGALGVVFLPRVQVTDLLVAGGRVAGVLALSESSGYLLLQAKAVILASGGGGALFLRHDNPRGITGEGYALALKAGISLQDMEFVQFYPFGVSMPGRPNLLLYPPYPEGARVVDEKGEDVLLAHGLGSNLNDIIIKQRDRSAQVLYNAGKHGSVFLDLSIVPDSAWKHSYPLELLRRCYRGLPGKLYPIVPVAHFFMGGIPISPQAETSLPGLFSAGEVCAGVHGANRMGGNALTECCVFGTIAGASAASFARQCPLGKVDVATVADRQGQQPPVKGEGELPKLLDLLVQELRGIAWDQAGPIRDGENLALGLRRIADLQCRIAEIPASSVRALRRKLELQHGQMVIGAILHAALAREESRGAHHRKDYPYPKERGPARSLEVSLVPNDMTFRVREVS